MKKIKTFSLLLALMIVFTGCGNQTEVSNMSVQDNTSTAANITKPEKIEVVDFHGSRRCFSCQTIEKYARETLEEFFQKELAEGKITFQSINGELAENQSIMLKYQARSSSLFVNAIRDGKANIEEDTMVWRLVSDEQKFKSYFKAKIEKLLN